MLNKYSSNPLQLSGDELDALLPEVTAHRRLMDQSVGAPEQGRISAVANALLNAANKPAETSFFIKYPMLSTALTSLSGGLLGAGIGGVLGGIATDGIPGIRKHFGLPAGGAVGGLLGSYIGKNVADWIRDRKIKKIKLLLDGASLNPSKIKDDKSDPMNNTIGSIYDNYTLATKLLLKQKQKSLNAIDNKIVNETFNPLLKNDIDYNSGVPTYENIKALTADRKKLLEMLKNV